MDHVADVPLLVLAVARPEFLERAPAFATGPAASRLSIHSLGGDNLDRLALATLELAGLPAGLGEEVRERCGGNPLFVEEFVRYLAEAPPTGGSAEAAAALVPDTLEALIAARLDDLSDDPRALLGDGAVVGQEFLAGGRGGDGVVIHRRHRRRAPHPDGSVSWRGCSRLDRLRRGGVHVPTCDGARCGLLATAAGGTCDEACAGRRWLEAMLGDRPDEMTGALAHHWVTALELSRASHQEDLAAATLGPAVRSLMRAGDHALALDVSIAEGQYVQALELAGPETRSGLGFSSAGRARCWTRAASTSRLRSSSKGSMGCGVRTMSPPRLSPSATTRRLCSSSAT